MSVKVFLFTAVNMNDMYVTFRQIIKSQNHGLEKTSKIIKSNHPPNNTMPTKSYPEMPNLHVL